MLKRAVVAMITVAQNQDRHGYGTRELIRRSHPLALSLILGQLLLGSLANATGELVIRITDAERDDNMTAMLFDSPEAFEDFRSPMRTTQARLADDLTMRIPDVPSGNYALVVFHDENSNSRLDFNFIGIPKEPIGFSNAYRPKGPPSFSRATFAMPSDADQTIDVALARPLGKRGRFGIGLAVIARGSPYAESSDNPVQFIPAVTYVGNRLQVYGPFAQLGLIGSGDIRLAASIAYRQAVYEADDSPVLTGMQDRDDTALAGLQLELEMPGGLDFGIGYAHDMLDRIGGGEAEFSVSRPIPWRSTRFSPSITLHWTDAKMVRHDYGITVQEATATRPAYQPDDAIGIELGVGIFSELTPSVIMVLNTSIEWFDNTITRSPIVDEDYVLKGFAAISYLL